MVPPVVSPGPLAAGDIPESAQSEAAVSCEPVYIQGIYGTRYKYMYIEIVHVCVKYVQCTCTCTTCSLST